jgi:hypothetical protein
VSTAGSDTPPIPERDIGSTEETSAGGKRKAPESKRDTLGRKASAMFLYVAGRRTEVEEEEGGGRREEGGGGGRRGKEEGGRRKEEEGRRKEEGGRRKDVGVS